MLTISSFLEKLKQKFPNIKFYENRWRGRRFDQSGNTGSRTDRQTWLNLQALVVTTRKCLEINNESLCRNGYSNGHTEYSENECAFAVVFCTELISKRGLWKLLVCIRDVRSELHTLRLTILVCLTPSSTILSIPHPSSTGNVRSCPQMTSVLVDRCDQVSFTYRCRRLRHVKGH
jgi:hypothetical protein